MLVIFGISGGTGRALASAGRDWRVRGMIRPSSQPAPGMPGVELVRGDFGDQARLAELVAGATAVCCVFGPRPPYAEVFCAEATRAVIAAMRESTCRRLICQSGALIGHADNVSWIFGFMGRAYSRRYPIAAQDRIEQERVVEESGLEWTIVKPPRLTDGPARGSVRAGTALRVGLLSKISRADLAGFMIQEIENPRFNHMRVFVRG